MATEMNRQGATKEQGVLYTFDGESSYDAPEVTAEILKNIEVNHLVVKVARNQVNLIFTKPFTITVRSSDNDDVDDRITGELNEQLGPIDLWGQEKEAWMDKFLFGANIRNYVYKYEGAKYVIKDIRKLPAGSFTGTGDGDFIITSPILQGIGLNRDKKMEYWQTQEDMIPVKLDEKSIMMFTAGSGIAGTPIVLPLVPLITFYKWCLNALSQKINREGVGKVYPKLTGPAQAGSRENGGIGDAEYLKLYMEGDSKDESYALRENMDLVDPHLHDSNVIIDAMDMVIKQIFDFFSPADMISKDGTLIGGSSASELGLVLRYISGWHEEIEKDVEALLTPWLLGNGYTGFYIDVDIPEPEIDTSELDLKRAAVAVKTTGKIKANELRAWLGLEELEELKDVFIEKSEDKGEVETFKDDCCRDLEELCLKFEN
ncbi:MAG: hypothetical protein WCQ65_10660 [Fermentimonas sp.]|jgi:hypothetical protein